jgi:RHS repeat-associated protein
VAGTVSDRNYTYDEAGNILSVEDKPQVGAAEKQCFRSDALGRLTTAWTPKSEVDCKTTDPNLADLAGPAPYWTDWTFDNAGNRKTEISHAAAGDTLRSYELPEKTHRVNSMTTTAPGQAAATAKYRFDLSGNMTCRPAVGSSNNDCDTKANSQILDWDAEGELATVKVGGSTIEENVYDAEGTRLVRRDATGTTVYLPNQEIRKEGSVVTGTRYYTLGGAVCASRRASSAVTDLTWLFNDHQGTQQLAVNAGTQVVTIRRQTPYGAPRGATTAWVNGKGFVGGDNDPTGLVNIGARQYDPVLGRFISVDPVMNLDDPNQWNAYAYANSNPITRSDPTGLEPRPWHNPNYDPATCENSTSLECHPYGQDEKIAESDARSRERDRVEAQARAEAEAERERKRKECEASFWCRAKNTAKSVASTAWTTLKSPEAIGIIAGITVGLTCTALTGGGGALLCGALGGSITGFVTAKLQCDQGEAGKCGAGNLIRETAIGAGLGLLGGAGGSVLGGLATGGLKGARVAVSQIGRQTDDAARGLFSTRFIDNTVATWRDDVVKRGGGALAHVRVTGDTIRLAGKGVISREGATGAVLGGVWPGTFDEAKGLSEGISLDPVKTPIQMLGGALGGALP